MSMPPPTTPAAQCARVPSTPRRSCAPAAGWPYRCRRASLAYGAALILLMLLSVALALTLGAQGLSWRELPTVLAAARVQQWLAYTLRLRVPRWARARRWACRARCSQSVTRNPLGSPDVIGLTAGASAGAVATAMVWPGLLPGGLGRGRRRAAGHGRRLEFGSGAGFAAPQRMVVAGIAVGALALAFVQYALSNLRREQAHLAATWLNGNLAGKTWSDAQLIALACAVLLPLAMALAARLRLLEMGDELATRWARGPGTRSAATLIAVLAAAAAVASPARWPSSRWPRRRSPGAACAPAAPTAGLRPDRRGAAGRRRPAGPPRRRVRPAGGRADRRHRRRLPGLPAAHGMEEKRMIPAPLLPADPQAAPAPRRCAT